jgi:hypothetical protein
MTYFLENSMDAGLWHAQGASHGGEKADDFMLCICCPLDFLLPDIV